MRVSSIPAILLIVFFFLTNSLAAIERIELLWNFGPPKEPIEFIWNEQNEPYLVKLREEYKLDSLIEGAKSDLERIRIICDWVHRQWRHNSNSTPEKNDPLAILKKAASGFDFSCLEYASVTAGCLNSLGIRSRIVDLLPKDYNERETGLVHVVVEAYLNDKRKWVMVDAQWNAVPMVKNYPLNCIELQTVISRNTPGLSLPNQTSEFTSKYVDWIYPYLYYICSLFDQRIYRTEIPYRKHGSAILYPLGAPKIKNFKDTELKKARYTNVISEFYAPPK